MRSCDFLIVGAGIVGLTTARALVSQGANRIAIIEKESGPGHHASGRNSGVLHAGIYYSPDSHKARFCIEGNHLMKEYCRNKNLDLRETGKVIVARDKNELEGLHELKRRAEANGARAFLITDKELLDLEPHARTHHEALHSPDTAIVDPHQILRALEHELKESGKVEFYYSSPFIRLNQEDSAQTATGEIRFENLINAAGAYADRIAAHFQVGLEYRILPFKGTYRKVKDSRSFLVNGNIYPVPDLKNPFLGVHFSRSIHDDVFIGPTAIPGLGRENYRFFQNLSFETPMILYRNAVLFLRNRAFRFAASTEPRKYFASVLYKEARELVPELRFDDLESCDKVGIRPQLVHWPSGQLVMDFVVLKGNRSLHVLNAVSPAFTSSMAFAKYVVHQVER